MESSLKIKPTAVTFDPFSDRRSRDVRNQLSEAFVSAIKTMDPSLFEISVRNIIADQPFGIYHDFITVRLATYRRTFDKIRKSGLFTPQQQVPVLWNHGLFFEVHELLEGLWHQAHGPLRQALKGLIQAAGVYVHLERGNRKAAAGLAKRALIHLQEAGDCLSFIDGIAVLVQKLQRLDNTPPSLASVSNDDN